VTAARLAKQVIKTYKTVKQAQAITRKKLETLIESNARYKLFEHDKSHPYYALAGDVGSLVTTYTEFIAGILGWESSSRTLQFELDKIKALQIVNGAAADADLDELRLISQVDMSTAEVAKKLLGLMFRSIVIVSVSEQSAINYQLELMVGKKLIKLHKEVPEIMVAALCRAPVRELKKLGRELVNWGKENTTLRAELENIQNLNMFKDTTQNHMIRMLIKR